MKLLPLGARLAAFGVLAWGYSIWFSWSPHLWWTASTFDSVDTVPTVLDWFMLLGTVGAGVALVRRKDPRWVAGIGGVMATIGTYLGLAGRSGGEGSFDEQVRPFLDAASAWWGFVLNGIFIVLAGVPESFRRRPAALEPNRSP